MKDYDSEHAQCFATAGGRKALSKGSCERQMMADANGDPPKQSHLIGSDDELQNAVFEHASVGMAIITLDGEIVHVNEALCEMLGFPRDELLGEQLEAINHPDDVARTRDVRLQMAREDTPRRRTETRFLRKDGWVLWTSVRWAAVGLEDDAPSHLITTIADISEQKRALIALEDQERRMSTLFHMSPDSIAVLRLSDECYLDVNERFLQAIGLTRDQVVGQTMSELDVWADETERDVVREKLMSDGEIHGLESHFRLGDGSILDTVMSAKVVEMDGETCVLAVVSDVSALKTSEKRVQRLNRVYAVLSGVNQALVRLRRPQQIFTETCRVIVEDGGFSMARVGLVEPDGIHVRCVAQAGRSDDSGAFHIVLGSDASLTSPVAEAIVSGSRQVIQNIERDAAPAPWRDAALAEGHRSSAAFPLSVDGHVIGALNIAAAEPDFFDEQHMELLAELADDVSFALAFADEQEQRAIAEKKLRSSEAKFSTAFHTSPDAVNINRLSDGLFIDTNLGFTELTGYTAADVAGKTSLDIAIWADEADRERLVAGLLSHNLVTNLEAQFRHKDGSLTTALMSARVVEMEGERCILSITRDMSERKRAEERHRDVLATAMDGFWLCDQEGQILEVNEAYCEMSGYSESELLAMNIADLEVFETSAEAVSEHAARVVGLGHDRFETQHRRKDGSIFDIESSVRYQPESGLFSAFQRDITDRKRAEAQLATAFASLVEVVSKVVESRDPYTSGHQKRVAELSMAIALEMGMPSEQVEEIRYAALVHDIGKMSIPAEILSKPGALIPAEFALIKRHAEAGFEILRSANTPGLLPEIVYQHHERCDGSGYPRALKAEQLLPAAKVIMVADVVEAMSSHRPYRAALGIPAALDEIRTGSGTRYCSDASEACLRVFGAGFTFTEA